MKIIVNKKKKSVHIFLKIANQARRKANLLYLFYCEEIIQNHQKGGIHLHVQSIIYPCYINICKRGEQYYIKYLKQYMI
jgi:hypothetical protein